MTKATFNLWLANSQVLPTFSNLAYLVIAVRNCYAQEWLTHRLSTVITRTLTSIAGYQVRICFVCENYAKGVAVNPLEDRLQEYLSQFDDEPETALSLRRIAYLERLLIQAGVIPTNPIELPVNITPELLNTLLIEGDEPMTNQTTLTYTRVRIHTHVTQSRFLHVEDALNIGKIRLFAGNYRRGQGMETYSHHFIDLADARVIFGALARGEQGFSHKEYKGTPPQNGHAAVSRVLSIAVKGENVYIELKTGPGKLTNTGAITPNGKAEVEVNVGFKLYEARRMAASVLAYIHAWDVMRMMVNQHLVSKPVPYLLVPATHDGNGVNSFDSAQNLHRTGQGDRAASSQTTNGIPKPPSSPLTPVVTGNGDRPVTRKEHTPTAAKPTNGAKVAPVAQQSDELGADARAQALGRLDGTTALPQLVYGDGTRVDPANVAEAETFQRFVAKKKIVPQSRAALQAYYRQLAAA
jgi:hypothetical protein